MTTSLFHWLRILALYCSMHVLCTRSIFLQHSKQDVWLLILYHVEMKNCIYTSSQCKTLEVTMCGLLSDRSDVITVWGSFWTSSYCTLEKNNTTKRCLRGVRLLNTGSCSTFIYGNTGSFSLLYMNNLREIS